jgi:hypothetical protein
MMTKFFSKMLSVEMSLRFMCMKLQQLSSHHYGIVPFTALGAQVQLDVKTVLIVFLSIATGYIMSSF